MLRRSLIVLSKPSARTGRTIVRDPRKAKSKPPTSAITQQTQQQQIRQHYRPLKPLPFAPNDQNQQTMGLGSYVIAGFGVALGFTLVGALFGG